MTTIFNYKTNMIVPFHDHQMDHQKVERRGTTAKEAKTAQSIHLVDSWSVPTLPLKMEATVEFARPNSPANEKNDKIMIFLDGFWQRVGQPTESQYLLSAVVNPTVPSVRLKILLVQAGEKDRNQYVGTL